jgi:hypothetical protein
LAAALLVPLLSVAQNEEDALRVSDIQPGGTGRSTGMANAFGALGADGAAIGINPAGMGLFRITELSVTPALEVNEARSTHYGNSVSDTRTKFHMNNFMLAVHNPARRDGKWRSSTYGIAFDRQATHQWDRRALAEQVPSTLLQQFVNEAEGHPGGSLDTLFPFTSGLAWNTFAINPLDDSLAFTFVSAIPFGSMVRMEQTYEERGASSNTAFFYSGSYLDRLYFGASVGISNHRFERLSTHTETTLDQNLDLATVTYTEDLSTTGGGLDLKLGVIGRVTDEFRLGVAYHSPCWLNLNDAYFTGMTTTFRTPDANGRTSYAAGSPDGLFSYQVRTPWRMVFSGAYVFGGHGLVSVDYTYMDPRRMELRSEDITVYDFAAENARIASDFEPVHSVRAGTEWRHGNWYYRLGWGFLGNPYREGDARRGDAQRTYAGGLGYRTDHVGVDLGLNMVTRSGQYYQYDPSLVEATTEERKSYRTMLTLSFRP